MFNDILPTLGIDVRFVDGDDPAEFVAAADDKTRAFFCEGVSNPSLTIFDIEGIAEQAHSIGLPLVVDSTFSTPYLCKPFDFGADVVVSSLTKWVGGHGAGLGGIVVDSGKFPWGAGKHPNFDIPDTSYGGEAGLRWGHDLPDELQPLAFKFRCMTVPLRNLGGCISPDNAWIIVQGIETLSLRMERHCENAIKVAEYLQNHPKVDWVRYPGLPNDSEHEKAKKYLKGKGGGMVVFGIKSDDDATKAGSNFIDSLKLHSHVANVGDVRSLAIHPASTTHSQLTPAAQIAAGVAPELIRLSVGIECCDDIIADLEQALAKTN
jgi:O-acetylhomoserine (thiol)-lyase